MEEVQYFFLLPGTIDDDMYNFESFLVEHAIELHFWCELDSGNRLTVVTLWPF